MKLYTKVLITWILAFAISAPLTIVLNLKASLVFRATYPIFTIILALLDSALLFFGVGLCGTYFACKNDNEEHEFMNNKSLENKTN
jgi:hypothetical protein